MDKPPETPTRVTAQHAVVLALLVVGLGILVVRLADVLMMAFGAILVAVLLHAVAAPLQSRVRAPRAVALTAAVALIALVVGAAIWAFGRQAEAQFVTLTELLPRAWSQLNTRLAPSPVGAAALTRLEKWQGFDWLVSLGPKLAAQAVSALAGTVIVLFAGLYLAYHPQSYLGGVLLLFPKARRARAATIFAELHRSLRQWLVGQVCSMFLVGGTTGVGLALAGVPSAVALGIIAGFGQFVPVIGPMAAAVPGLIIALESGPRTLLWAGVVYLAAAQVEANLITPLVLRQLAQVPMALTLFAVLAMGVLLGPLGVLFATPLAVVAYVLVRMVYVEDVLGERLTTPR